MNEAGSPREPTPTIPGAIEIQTVFTAPGHGPQPWVGAPSAVRLDDGSFVLALSRDVEAAIMTTSAPLSLLPAGPPTWIGNNTETLDTASDLRNSGPYMTTVPNEVQRGHARAMKGTMKRFGQVIGVKPARIADYEAIHVAVWPEVLALIHQYNIRNYSIFRHSTTLFAYMEYVGDDFEADMAAMAEEPVNKRWWALTDTMQEPIEGRAAGEWWANMAEVFHTD